jgi:hypothetical protein
MTHYKSLALAASAVALLAACESGDPVTAAGNATGTALLVSAVPSTATLPAGVVLTSAPSTPPAYYPAATTFAYAGFNGSFTNAFARKQTDATLAQRSQFFINTGLLDTLNYYRFPAEVARVGTGDRIDPRTPALSATVVPQIVGDPNASGSPAALYVFRPGSYSVGEATNTYYRVRSAFTGLTGGATYQLVFVQYRDAVTGELDQEQRILNGAVTEPDVLTPPTTSSPYAGEPNTTPFDAAAEEPTCGTGPLRTNNPFIAAQFVADGGGAAFVDRCWEGGSFTFFGRSDDTPYDLPGYNYIELWEGGYGTGTPVLRIQVAQDVDPDGVPLNNAYPPFPAPGMTTVPNSSTTGPTAANPFNPAANFPKVDRLAAFPMDTTTANNADPATSFAYSLPGAYRIPNVVTGKLFNLQALTAGVYKLWLVNRDGSLFKPATGTLAEYTFPDGVPTAGQTVTGPIEFTSAIDTAYFTLDPYTTITGAPGAGDSLFNLVVTKEDAAGAGQPGASQPLWVSVARLPGVPGFGTAAGNLAFGTFSSRLHFVPQGSLSGGVIGDTNSFRDARIDLKLTGLMRPPVGYEYHGFLLPSAAAAEDIGTILGPDGQPLTDADVTVGGPVTETAIVSATLDHSFATASGTPAICGYDGVAVYLVPKGDVDAPVTAVFEAGIPGAVLGSPACAPPAGASR